MSKRKFGREVPTVTLSPAPYRNRGFIGDIQNDNHSRSELAGSTVRGACSAHFPCYQEFLSIPAWVGNFSAQTAREFSTLQHGRAIPLGKAQVSIEIALFADVSFTSAIGNQRDLADWPCAGIGFFLAGGPNNGRFGVWKAIQQSPRRGCGR